MLLVVKTNHESQVPDATLSSLDFDELNLVTALTLSLHPSVWHSSEIIFIAEVETTSNFLKGNWSELIFDSFQNSNRLNRARWLCKAGLSWVRWPQAEFLSLMSQFPHHVTVHLSCLYIDESWSYVPQCGMWEVSMRSDHSDLAFWTRGTMPFDYAQFCRSGNDIDWPREWGLILIGPGLFVRAGSDLHNADICSLPRFCKQ